MFETDITKWRRREGRGETDTQTDNQKQIICVKERSRREKKRKSNKEGQTDKQTD